MPNPSPQLSNNLRGALWGLGMVTGLGGVSIAIRTLKPDIALQELLFFRAFIGLVAISIIMAPNGWRILIPRRPGLQIVRNLFHMSAQYCVFFAVVIIPLAEVTAIEFLVPLITALMAAPLLKEKIGRSRWIGMIVGFVGICGGFANADVHIAGGTRLSLKAVDATVSSGFVVVDCYF